LGEVLSCVNKGGYSALLWAFLAETAIHLLSLPTKMDFRRKIDFRQQMEELVDNFTSTTIKEEEQKKSGLAVVHPTTEHCFTIFDRCVFTIDVSIGNKIQNECYNPVFRESESSVEPMTSRICRWCAP
jgi:hypothetical protein